MRKLSSDGPEAGFSIIELLIVLVVIGIVVTFAVASFGDASRSFDRQNIAREFKVSLERARFDSVKRGPKVCSDMSGVTINDTAFTLMIDLNRDGALGATDVRQTNLSSRSAVNIVPNGLTLPITIRFDARGRAFINDCDPASVPTANVPLLFFCDGPCTALTANGSNSNVVFVSPAGTVAMLYGGETMPTFANAAVNSVANNLNLSPLLVEWSVNGTGATPGPSPSPTITPENTPVDPPASPTPTPAACPTSAPWGSPPQCECQLPMTVRNNGQCKG